MTRTKSADKEVTILIMIDACRKDYLRDAEYITTLAPYSQISNLEGTFGFKSTTGGWAAGLYPESSDLYSIFSYSPDNSPFRVFQRELLRRSLGGIEKLLRATLGGVRHDRLLYHSPAYLLRHFLAIVLRRVHQNPMLTLSEVPYELLPHFGIAESRLPTEVGYLTKPTLFDVLRANGKTWLYKGQPEHITIRNGRQVSSLKDSLRNEDYDFIFLHVIDLDGMGHMYGPSSSEVYHTTQRIDALIEELHEILVSRYRAVNTIIFSDHGMVEVEKTLDMRSELNRLPLVLGRDYLVFLDSPSVRFWFLNQKARGPITDTLEALDDGRILSSRDLEISRIRFGHRKYWDLIFLANPGVLIFPNFFQAEFPIQGMHGYETAYRDNQGMFLLHSTKEKITRTDRSVHMVDVFPTALDLMGLPVPSNSGTSVLVAT